MKRLVPLCFALVLLLMGRASHAQVAAVPTLMNFQGRLARPDGTPVPNGTYTVTFRLFSVPTGGTALWSHTLPVTVRNGTFAALLGGSTGTKSGPLASTLFSADRWIEIQQGSDAPLSPRQQVASMAYAMKADSVKDNAITSASISNGSITNADLAAGTLNPLAWLLGGNSGSNPTSHFLGTTDNQSLVFRTNNTERMRLSGSGNLGIGTNTPVNPLSVAGRANFESYVGIGINTAQWPLHVASTGGLFIGQDAATGGFTGLHVSLSAASNGYVSLQGVKAAGSAWGDLILNRSGGNVGIGTTASSAKLLVRGNVDIGASYAGPLLYATNFQTNGEGVLGSAFGENSIGVLGQSNQGWGIRSIGRAGGSSGWQSSSDARYKQNVATLEDPLDAILNLRGVTFDWKRDEFKDMNFTKGRQIGFIAQEVETILPEIVHTDGKGYKSVIYANVVPVLVEAMKLQQNQIEGKQQQINALKAENVELRAELSAIKAAVRQLQNERK